MKDLSDRLVLLFPLSIVVLIVCPSMAFANAGIPMIIFELPFMVLLLVPVILLEAGLLSRFCKVNIKESLILMTKANLLSTLVGFPLSWILHLLAGMAFSIFPYMAYKFNFTFISESIYQNNQLLFDILGLLVAPWLAPVENKLYWMIPAAGFIGLIPAYFVTVFFEYKFFKRKCSFESGMVKKTIVKINLYSYLFLALIWTGQIFYNMQLMRQGKDIFIIPFSFFE